MLPHIFSILPDQLSEEFRLQKFSNYRVNQIYHWLFSHHITSLKKMHNIPQTVKDYLIAHYSFNLPDIAEISHSDDDSTKFLLQLTDNENIEMVVMPNSKKQTLCISSQVGCSRKCRFCATGNIGLIRNVSYTEIVSQVFLSLQQSNSLTNIVFMGMGEPLDNFENVIKAIQILQHEKMFSFSPRRITLSTCGIVPEIYRLADTKLKLKLAVSLNAIFDEKRSYLMPINQKYPLAKLKKALYYFTKINPYRVTLEYVMIKNFNMSDADVKELLKYTNDLSCKINLIPWNYISGSEFLAPNQEEIISFQNKLKQGKAAVTLRISKGDDINAACGQLAANYNRRKDL